MLQHQTAQSSTRNSVLSEKLEQLTMEEQQAEQDLRRIQEQIKHLEQKNQTK